VGTVKRALILLGLCLAAGCGPTSVREEAVTAQPLAHPSVVLVYQFAVDADDVVVDTLGPAFLRARTRAGTRGERTREIARLVQHELVGALTDQRIAARPVTQGAAVEMGAAVLKGQFVTRVAGDAAGRLVVGPGGEEELRVRVQVYRVTERGLERLEVTAAAPAGAGRPGASGAPEDPAAVVTAASVSAATRLKGPLEVRVRDLAVQVARVLAGFYDRQGWHR
jgi:hypothetical protein